MVRAVFRVVILVLLVAAGSVGYWWYHNPSSPAMTIKRLEQEKKELQQIVGRLTDEKRVAHFIAWPRKVGEKTQTQIFFSEIRETKDGTQKFPTRSYLIDGDEVHIDALSIRFENHFVFEGDPLKGRGLVLFTRLYGANQPPENAYAIDDPNVAPAIYRGDAPESEQSKFEKELWKDFWKLVNDRAYRKDHGVKIASGKGVWIKQLDRKKLYVITVDAMGNPTLEAQDINPLELELREKAMDAAAKAQ